MQEKHFELRMVTGRPGNYTAVMYNALGGYYKEVAFLWYSKREMYYKLRHEYGCVVSRDFR